MIYSMTAFARTQGQGEWGSLVCEIRSINHRFLEISLHLPEALRHFEMPIREIIRKYLKRGKIECNLRYQADKAENASQIRINLSLAQELCIASQKISQLIQNAAPINPTEILHFPGVLESKQVELDATSVLQLIEKTIQELVAMRGREGQELKNLFIQRLDLMRLELAIVRKHLPQVVLDQQTRLRKKFLEANIELDATRLEQEMVLFANKIDITEEIDRTETHIVEILRALEQAGGVGRRLDFLLQELNREANTMGSKSVDAVITHTAVAIKVLIEQIREQVQNVE